MGHHIRIGVPDPLEGGLSLLQFSPDWSLAASCGARGLNRLVITVWGGPGRDWFQGAAEPLLSLQGHQHPVTALAFLPGLRRLASSAEFDPGVRIWDLRSGVLLACIEESGRDAPVSLLAGTRVPCFALAVGTVDGAVSVYSATTLQPVCVIAAAHEGPPRSLLFGGATAAPHPEDEFDDILVSGDDSTTCVWDLQSGQQLRSQPTGAEQLLISPDRSWLVAGSHGVVMLYRLRDLTLHGIFAHPGAHRLSSFALCEATGASMLLTIAPAAPEHEALQTWSFPGVFSQRDPVPTNALPQPPAPAGSSWVQTQASDKLLSACVHPSRPVLVLASKFRGDPRVWQLEAGEPPGSLFRQLPHQHQALMCCAVLVPTVPAASHCREESEQASTVHSSWPVLLLAGMSDGCCALVDMSTRGVLAHFVANSDRRSVSCIAVGFLSCNSVLLDASSEPAASPAWCVCKRCGERYERGSQALRCKAHPGEWGRRWRNIGKGKSWGCCKATDQQAPGCTAVPHVPDGAVEVSYGRQLTAVVYTGSANGEVRCSTLGGTRIHVLRGHTAAVKCVSAAQLSDGESSLVVSGASDRSVNVWVMASGEPSLVLQLLAPCVPVWVCLSERTQTHILAGLESGETAVWAIEAGVQVACYPPPGLVHPEQLQQERAWYPQGAPRGGLVSDQLFWEGSEPRERPVSVTVHSSCNQVSVALEGSTERLLQQLRHLTELCHEAGFEEGWSQALLGPWAQEPASSDTQSEMTRRQLGLQRALKDAIGDRCGPTWMNALRGMLCVLPCSLRQQLPMFNDEALGALSNQEFHGLAGKHHSEPVGLGYSFPEQPPSRALNTELTVFTTALCGILFGVPDPEVAGLAKQLFQRTLLPETNLSIHDTLWYALSSGSPEMRDGATALAERRRLGCPQVGDPQEVWGATEEEAVEARRTFGTPGGSALQHDVACVVLLTAPLREHVPAPELQLVQRAAAHLGAMLSFPSYEHLRPLLVSLLCVVMGALAQRGTALHDIIDVLVSNVLHAPDSTPLAASAASAIAMRFPAEVTEHLVGLLEDQRVASTQTTKATCRLLQTMLAQSMAGHPVQLHAKKLLESLLRILRQEKDNDNRRTLLGQVTTLMHTMIKCCCNIDFDPRTSLVAVSSRDSHGTVHLFDLELSQHRFALPPRGQGGDVEMVAFSKHDYLIASFVPESTELALWRLITQRRGTVLQVTEVKHELTCKVNLDQCSPSSSPVCSPSRGARNSSSLEEGLEPQRELRESLHTADALVWHESGIKLRVTMEGQSYSINVHELLAQARQARLVNN